MKNVINNTLKIHLIFKILIILFLVFYFCIQNSVYVMAANAKNKQTTELKLESLIVEGFDLSEDFNSDKYLYTINVDSNCEKLNIKATANLNNSKIIIDGSEGFIEGENIVNIIVKSSDEKQTVVYQILVNKEKVKKESSIININGNKKIELSKNQIIAIIVGIIVVLIFLIIIRKISKHNKYEDTDEEETENTNKKEKDNTKKPKKSKTKGKHA